MGTSVKVRIAVYTRVSTLDQSRGKESQAHAIKRYLESHGLKAKWFSDVMTGATTNRPDFQKLQKAIFHGEVDTVVVWKLDRISRSLKDGITVLTEWLEKKVRIVAVSQQLDFSGPTGQLVASVLFAIAAMERENIRENTKRGLLLARQKGIVLGGKVAGRVKWTAEVAPLIASGMSIAEIAIRFNKSKQAIYNVLNGRTKVYDPTISTQKRHPDSIA